MYDQKKFQEAFERTGLNFYRLSKLAGVDPKTAKKIIVTGHSTPDCIYAVAKALGFPVYKFGGPIPRYDLRAILQTDAA